MMAKFCSDNSADRTLEFHSVYVGWTPVKSLEQSYTLRLDAFHIVCLFTVSKGGL